MAVENGDAPENSGVNHKELNSALLSSSTKCRLAELSRLEKSLADASLPESSALKVVPSLLRTYPSYRDRPSRKAVQNCLRTLLINGKYSDALPLVLAFFGNETSKAGLAASNAFVLVEWGSVLVTQLAIGEEAWEAHGMEVVNQHASILETCMVAQGKSGVKHSALVTTRRALRHLFHGEKGDQRARQIIIQLTATTSAIGVRGAVLLGVVAGVCARYPPLSSALATQKGHYISFYLREMVGSRTTVPNHLANALEEFFSSSITSEDLERDIGPAFEKALLRAPEVVLDDLLSPMLGTLPQSVDVALLLSGRLAKPLLSNVKSSNARVREGAVLAFTNAVNHSKNEEYLLRVADEVLNPLSSSKLTAADHRALHSRILTNLPHLPGRSEAICKALAAVAVKESNEAALYAELHALSHHLSLLIQTRSLPDETIKACTEIVGKGLSDKKPAHRRAWVLMTGDVLWQTRKYGDAPKVRLFIDATIPRTLEMFQEVTSNVLAATQSGLVVAGFVLTALYTYIMDVVGSSKIQTSIRKASIVEQACSLNPKLSFLIGHRVYSKLVAPQDLKWSIRALQACSPWISQTDNASMIGDAWAQAFLYFVSATAVPHEIRKVAVTALHDSYLEQPSPVALRMVKGLWSWQEHLTVGQQDSAAASSKSGSSRLYLAVHAICPTREEVRVNASLTSDMLQDQLIELLVLCRPPLIPHISWIGTCLSVGQDPGDLVRSAHERCLVQIKSCAHTISDDVHKAKVRAAASDAAAELAFVSPDTIIPQIVQDVVRDLSAAAVRTYSPTDFAIARTPQGTTFVDVLSTKSNDVSIIDKNTKDYDTLRWEAELRSQLASKKGQERKVTADEKAKVDAQMKKEDVIRKNVLALEERLRRGVGLINALTKGPPTDSRMWFGPCSTALLDIITAGAGLIMGNIVEMAYLDLSKLIATRLGSLREFVGVAILRAVGTPSLPDNIKQEPLGGKMLSKFELLILWIDEFRAGDQSTLSLAISKRTTPS
ncbi:MAG: hypothetical protein Q9182_006762 [Xanthomendoza sp. 2 TL-2023]